MTCVECELLKTKRNLIYEDSLCAAFLANKPAVPGQVIVISKIHYPILENIPDDTIAHEFLIANKISTVCFEIFKARGTNILINNGIAAGQKTSHSRIKVLLRFENDNLNLQWNTLKLTEDEMNTAQLALTSEIEKNMAEGYKVKETVLKEKEIKELPKEEEVPEEENYMLKQLDRVP